MAKVNQAQEPSMEEILASIRRIIADDEPVPAAVETAEPPVPATVAETTPAPASAAMPQAAPLPVAEPQIKPDSVFGRDDRPAPISTSVAETVRPPVTQNMPPPSPPVLPPILSFQPRPSAPVAAAIPPPKAQATTLSDELPAGGPLLSPSSDAIVQSAFGSLANTILAGNQRTLEDLVKDMLRPMLKAWLDTNLPHLVEKLVRDEIERVSRGR